MIQKIPYPHPGADLKDIIDEMNLSQAELSRRTAIPTSRINEIIKGRCSISAEYSIRLGRFFGQSDSFWLNMQQGYDMRQVQAQKGTQIEKEVHPWHLGPDKAAHLHTAC